MPRGTQPSPCVNYLIDTIGDAIEMRDFYDNRIKAENNNLDSLRRQAKNVGWNI